MTDLLYDHWEADQRPLLDQMLAAQVHAAVLLVVRSLGTTVESARAAEPLAYHTPVAAIRFDPAPLTITVRFTTHSATASTRSMLGCLIDNGFHGFIGAFGVDSKVEPDSDDVVIQLSQGSDREPLDDPEKIVAAASHLMP
jgi:hypothetical protein